jgi:hypothetical protein
LFHHAHAGLSTWAISSIRLNLFDAAAPRACVAIDREGLSARGRGPDPVLVEQLLTFAGRMTRGQQSVTEYLLAENAVLREQLRGRRFRYTNRKM